MKFCKDCKWYWSVASMSWCGSTEGCSNPKNGKSHIEPVHGVTVTTGVISLEALRSSHTACGPTAKWFEEKEKPIPKCIDCKWFATDTGECLKKETHTYTGQEVYLCTNADFSRRCETMCWKYGKWWEKKEEPIGTIIEYKFIPDPKKQSWLCRLICGRKNDRIYIRPRLPTDHKGFNPRRNR